MRLHSIRDLWLRMNQKKGNNLIMNENFTTAKGSVQCSEKDELNITKMHHAFADIRGSLDVNRYHLEQIIKVLYGNVGDDEDISKQPNIMPDPLPHLCHLSSNLDILRRKISEEDDLIGKIYDALGMDPEEKY